MATTVARTHEPGNELRRGQTRIGLEVLKAHGDRLMYVAKLGWYCWAATHWQEDPDGAEAMTAALDTLGVMRADLPKAGKKDSPKRRELADDINRVERAASALRGSLEIARTQPPIRTAVDDLDSDPFLFNTRSGTLDLRTCELRPARPADRITKLAGAAYDPAAVCPRFDAFLARVQPDPEVRAFLARIFGLALLGELREQRLFIFSGDGANGKSTLLGIARRVLGDYAIEALPTLLTSEREHPTEQADLMGVRLATCEEQEKTASFAEATLKRLTGVDTLRARKIARDSFPFANSVTLVMDTNHLPRINGDDPALRRRIVVVPFAVKIPEAEWDKGLLRALTLESDGILRWVVDGWRDYWANGLQIPGTVRETSAAYLSEHDALGQFISDRCLTDVPGAVAQARALYSAYTEWCRQAGEVPTTEADFKESMTRRGHQSRRTNTGRKYEGIQLREGEVDL
jgi:putative DNA primase/helicase